MADCKVLHIGQCFYVLCVGLTLEEKLMIVIISV